MTEMERDFAALFAAIRTALKKYTRKHVEEEIFFAHSGHRSKMAIRVLREDPIYADLRFYRNNVSGKPSRLVADALLPVREVS